MATSRGTHRHYFWTFNISCLRKAYWLIKYFLSWCIWRLSLATQRVQFIWRFWSCYLNVHTRYNIYATTTSITTSRYATYTSLRFPKTPAETFSKTHEQTLPVWNPSRQFVPKNTDSIFVIIPNYGNYLLIYYFLSWAQKLWLLPVIKWLASSWFIRPWRRRMNTF